MKGKGDADNDSKKVVNGSDAERRAMKLMETGDGGGGREPGRTALR